MAARTRDMSRSVAAAVADQYIGKDGGEPSAPVKGHVRRVKLANAIADVRAELKKGRSTAAERNLALHKFEEIIDVLRTYVDMTAQW